jgi:hypothetical protein
MKGLLSAAGWCWVRLQKMPLKNSRKKSDPVQMKILLLVLPALFLFSRCKEKQQLSTNSTLSAAKELVRKVDSTSLIPGFEPGNSAFAFKEEIFNPYFPQAPDEKVPASVTYVQETSVFDGFDGKKNSLNNEFWLRQGYVYKMIKHDTLTEVANIRLDTFGRPLQVVRFFSGTKDSATENYQYDQNNRLTGVLALGSGGGKEIEAKKFRYDGHGNLASVYLEDFYGQKYFDTILTNNKLRTLLTLRYNEKGDLTMASIIKYDSNGNIIVEEQFYNDPQGPALTKKTFQYSPQHQLESVDLSLLPIGRKMSFVSHYFKKDSAGLWTERIIFRNNKLFDVSKRIIKYN